MSLERLSLLTRLKKLGPMGPSSDGPAGEWEPRSFESEAWPLMPDVCPCDVDFVAYLAEHEVVGKRVFHFGTGLHHVVGRDNWKRGSPNEILAVTAGPEEHWNYVDLVTTEPLAAVGYKVLFTDIYTWTPGLAHGFDIVTLFHLGEYRTKVQDSYGAKTDKEVLALFATALNPGGRILGYGNSWGFGQADPLFTALVDAGQLTRLDDYRTLRVFARAPNQDG